MSHDTESNPRLPDGAGCDVAASSACGEHHVCRVEQERSLVGVCTGSLSVGSSLASPDGDQVHSSAIRGINR